MARSTGSVIASGSYVVAPTPDRVNFDALRTFIASRRPTFICVSSNGESRPGRAIAARHRTASAPYRSRMSVGTITLPLDLLIFLRSGSITNPEINAYDHGAV